MIEHFLATDNMPFSVALVLMFGIALLEGIATVIGFGISQFLDGIIPDFDIPEADVDADVEFETPSVLTKLLGWIKIKGVPMIVVLVVFLTIFSLSGLILQSLIKRILTFYLPWFIAIWPALFITLPFVRKISIVLSKFVLKDETSAVSTKTFVGKIATINIGTARKGMPAEARLTDKFGQVHYVMVEPDDQDDTFERYTEVLLVKKEGSVFKAIRNPNIKLTD